MNPLPQDPKSCALPNELFDSSMPEPEEPGSRNVPSEPQNGRKHAAGRHQAERKEMCFIVYQPRVRAPGISGAVPEDRLENSARKTNKPRSGAPGEACGCGNDSRQSKGLTRQTSPSMPAGIAVRHNRLPNPRFAIRQRMTPCFPRRFSLLCTNLWRGEFMAFFAHSVATQFSTSSNLCRFSQ